MRHFDHLPADVQQFLFSRPPGEFDNTSNRHILAQALGATLYVPGTKSALVATLRRRAAEGVRSLVIDLEDAVADEELEYAVRQVSDALAELQADPLPAMVFVRVRDVEQIRPLTDRLDGGAGHLTGFVLPKFSAANGARYLGEITAAADRVGREFLIMPVLETPDVLYRETRDEALSAIRELLGQYRHQILALRLGATDLCGVYGIRRERDLTIYDVGVVAELIAEVVNHLGRADGTGYAITGPVWEYFAGGERVFRPQLRISPFADRDATSVRYQLVRGDFDGLLREVVLDRANGLTGKTVIHPSHVKVVHSMSVVPHEEYADACDVLDGLGGARASGYRNKMNETRPHRRWAQRIVDRASVFGVTNDDISYVDVLSALSDSATR